MIQQQTVSIVSHEKLSEGCFVIGLHSPEMAHNSRPGQFVMLRLPGAMLLWGRAYSIFDVDRDNVFLLYKVFGRGTHLLCQKNTGDQVELIGPLGTHFAPPNEDDFSLLVGGGVGLPPLYFYAKTHIKLAPKMRVLIGARDKENVLLEKEFKDLGCQVEVATEDGSVGTKGLVTEILNNSIRNNSKIKDKLHICSCGPNAMLKAVGEMGLKNGIRTEISMEEMMACGLGVCIGCVVKTRCTPEQKEELKRDVTYTRLCCEGPVLDAGRVIWE